MGEDEGVTLPAEENSDEAGEQIEDEPEGDAEPGGDRHPEWFETPENGVVFDHLHPGEKLLVYAHGLLQIKLQLFKKCKVAVTDQRVLLFEPKWPWGYGLARSLRRETCHVPSFKERRDKSQLVLLRHEDEHEHRNFCLYFARRERKAATALRKMLGQEPPGSGPRA